MKIPKILPDMKKEKQILLVSFSTILPKCNSYHKTLRVLAYCWRFINNSRICKTQKENRITGHLKKSEIDSSLMKCIKIVQNETFQGEIESLKRGEAKINKQSSIRSLHPFLNDDGILLVGGRLHNTSLNESSKHPILLPSNHTFTEMILQEEHLRLLHAPPKLLLSSIRKRFWPVRGPVKAKKIVNNCI